MRFGRGQFAELVARQLDLFEREHEGLLRNVATAEQAYDRAPRDEAEERYSHYLDLVETCTELLADLRDNYGASLGEDAAEKYELAFNKAAARRFPELAVEL